MIASDAAASGAQRASRDPGQGRPSPAAPPSQRDQPQQAEHRGGSATGSAEGHAPGIAAAVAARSSRAVVARAAAVVVVAAGRRRDKVAFRERELAEPMPSFSLGSSHALSGWSEGSG
jgi:hypothetical protein